MPFGTNKFSEFEVHMTDIQHGQFVQRLRRIGDTNRKMAHGHVAVMNVDGLIVAQPMKVKSNSTVRSLFLCLIILWAFKIFLHASIGGAAYQERVSALQAGSMVQKLGAFVMVADPATVWIANMAVSPK